LRVQPARNFWTCRQCGRGGDLIAYQVETGRISTREAYQARHGGAVTLHNSAASPAVITAPAVCEPPGAAWQARAFEFTAQCQETLWSDAGTRAREWLAARGLNDETITRAGLGLNDCDMYEGPAAWGLPAQHKKIWLPRGITIPWFIGPHLWRVNIRRPTGEPRYIGPAGWGNGLYNADALATDKPAILVEGEIDALTIAQVAGDLVTPCATGSTGGARRARWIAKLALCPRVLVAFDADDAGTQARVYWLKVLSNGRHWRPFWGDANAMHQDGVDLRGWILSGIGG